MANERPTQSGVDAFRPTDAIPRRAASVQRGQRGQESRRRNQGGPGVLLFDPSRPTTEESQREASAGRSRVHVDTSWIVGVSVGFFPSPSKRKEDGGIENPFPCPRFPFETETRSGFPWKIASDPFPFRSKERSESFWFGWNRWERSCSPRRRSSLSIREKENTSFLWQNDLCHGNGILPVDRSTVRISHISCLKHWTGGYMHGSTRTLAVQHLRTPPFITGLDRRFIQLTRRTSKRSTREK